MEETKANVVTTRHIVDLDGKLNEFKNNSFCVLMDNRGQISHVSVIIPVYNTALYLEECLESICNQTLKEIEIICINDGSTDNSLEILYNYAEKDNRIVVCTQNNCGQSSARNKGVTSARGKYLYFMDSDDILELSALEILYKRAEADDVEVLYFDGDSFTNDSEYEELSDHYNKYYKRNFNYDGIYEGWALLSEMVKHDEYRVSPCLQFINRNHYMRHKIDFYEGIIHEDNLFNYKCMLCASRVEYLPLQLFHRRVRNNSTMTKKISFSNVYGYFICYLKMRQFYNEQNLCSIDNNMIFVPVKQMLNNCRNNYQQLLPEEKQIVSTLSCDQRQLFEAYVIDVCKQISDIKKKLNASLSREVSLKNSVSFRVGRAITLLPRKCRGCIICYKQHGLDYTLKRVFWHITHLK